MDADVIVVGAGPVGLLLAAELRLHGVRVVVLERLAEPTGFSKAGAMHARTVETLELRGLVDRFREAGREGILRAYAGDDPELRRRLTGRFAGSESRQHFAGIRTLRVDRLDSDHPGVFPILQADTEAVLADRAAGSGAEIRRGVEVTALDADAEGVTAVVRDEAGEHRVRAAYLVGCDGGRSLVRKAAGFGFPGTAPTYTGRLGDVRVPELMDDPGMGHHRLPGGYLFATPGRVMTIEFDAPPEDRGAPVTKEELAASLARVLGRRVEIADEPAWMSRFTDVTRQADTYRRGRVLLAGDAAHVHSPSGGQGLNLGLQDAVNLGWKLAAAVRGRAPDGLLDTYGAERHPVAARVLHNTRAQTALMNPDPRITPLRELFADLMEFGQVNRYLSEMITALDVRYDMGAPDHPLTGGFLPPLEVRTADGPVRARDLLRTGRALLLDLAGDAELRAVAAPWRDAVGVVTARPGDQDAGATAVLVRPDGYVAWAAAGGRDGLAAALARWFGERC